MQKEIRDTYKRLKRSVKLGTGSSAAVKRKNWPLFDYLSFFETVSEERSTISNVEKESQESNEKAISDADHNLVGETQSTILQFKHSIATPSTSSVASTYTPVRAHKRKMADNISKLLEENKKAREKIVEKFLDKTNIPQEDDVDVLSVKRLPPHLIAKAKLRHLETANELQLLASISTKGFTLTAKQVFIK
ncbi:unnamed protein product [Psylliodes chrysocephalus]|uniref:Uncharacterized protein n=1 Tax=Psylliodes chrysocephalus TaxID=3402493 RepID=A0A9P0GEP2_9CUCU|nr:unnamed protein product [Psylliodes chrysocephala]